MKLKARNGTIFSIDKTFKNQNSISLNLDLLSFGFGIHHYIGDSRRYLSIYFLFITFDLWY